MKNPFKWVIENLSYKSMYYEMCTEFEKMRGHCESYKEMLERCSGQRDRAMDKAEKYMRMLNERS